MRCCNDKNDDEEEDSSEGDDDDSVVLVQNGEASRGAEAAVAEAEHFERASSQIAICAPNCPANMGPNAEIIQSALNREKSEQDLAARVAPRAARVAVYFLLCQAVQMFMSYDGGALPASLDTLEELRGERYGDAAKISALQLSFLNAMDKVGMVCASVPWGIALKKCNAKLLLTCGLALNAATTVVFGFLWQSIPLMYLAKFIMGATQALQGVWGTVWTVVMAPPDQKTTWLGLGAVSAGIGNGIGMGVAGFGTANGVPYYFAFVLAGFVLSGLWVVQLFIPPSWLRVEIPEDEGDASEESKAQKQVEESAGKSGDCKQFIENRVYLWTTFSISLAMFQAAAIQFLWVQGFTSIWGLSDTTSLNKSWVTGMFFVFNGGGGFLGVFLGPLIIDKLGGFVLLPDMVRTLFVLTLFQILAGIGGVIGVWCLYMKFHSSEDGSYRFSGEWGDPWLWGTWVSIMMVMGSQNACVAALCGINVQVIPSHLRTSASGMEMTIRNVFGFIGGSVVPGIVMSLFDYQTNTEKDKQAYGLGVVLAINVIGFPMMAAARHSAAFELYSGRHKALADLREACQDEDIATLERAVTGAMQVKLQVWDEGAAALGVANELIGQLHASTDPTRRPSVASLARRQEAEISSLKSKIAELEAQVRSLGGTPAA